MFGLDKGVVRFRLVMSLVIFLLLGVWRSATSAEAIQQVPEKTSKTWHLAYYEGGDNSSYRRYLISTIERLMELGWVEPAEIPHLNNSKQLWYWLANNTKSNYIKFVEGNYYSAQWDQNLREKEKQKIIRRLTQENDIDLIFAMGTWAGEDLANNTHHTPTFVISASNPIESGIIKSADNSGYDHVFARVAPQRYEQQVRLFHDLVKFKKLGVAYENTKNGRTYAALNSITKVAKERQFEIISCYTQSDISERAIANTSVITCIDRLAKEVDALYITEQGGVNEQSIPDIVDIANKRQVATLSQEGGDAVKYGILMSVSSPDFDSVGLFLAKALDDVFKGAAPGNLNQLFKEQNSISINLKTAEIIGAYIYADWLAIADRIYRQIEQPETK
ncbi:ABC transporter substrate-binding protein [Alkalimarinus coralli]|uniref:ABC transporter substrate-binding protein n=1 Tax=Alkalimarinus coralli TaxID=2935863 RepID=UPI00202AFE72|nr:ABC transporter substrate binding protein [Alkalimarinus coralli]